MLVCNVSLRPARSAITADIAEITAAVDATATGQVVFATLVDDPANVGEIVDAYLGEIMLEAASAADSFDSGLGYAAAIVETTTAGDTQDGAVTTAPLTATWDPLDKSLATLSSGNLTATGTGAGYARATSVQSSGKYYWETTVSTWSSGNTGPYYGIAANAIPATGIAGLSKDGNIWVGFSPVFIGAARGSGDIIGIAIDITANLIWFRVAPSGNWNGSGTANPATGAGGLSISSLSGTLKPSIALSTVGDAATVNFGAAAFSGAVPSGFTAGWPA
jgi:hypothetical protein